MKNSIDEPKIPILTEVERFSLHLNDEENKRIMLSAGFGTGKSFFLNHFFNIKSEEFNFINLYPVDYSVTSNDDIFEIIKFDVLDALLSKYSEEIKLSEEDINQALITQEFIRNEANYYNIFKVLAKHFIPKGEALTDTIDILKKTFEAHNTFSSEINRKESENAEEFIKLIRSQKNSIREVDGTTLLIRDFLDRIRKFNDKPFILIIDDLDRLDPEHIFRIFNVFTAHHNSQTEENKFSFDKVVFVCDVNNIEHMFHHRFGEKAEFAGYVDKFYSKHIFQFKNRIFLKDLFHKLYITPKTVEVNPYSNNSKILAFKNLNKGYTFNRIFTTMVGMLIEADVVRLRNLIKFTNYDLPDYHFIINDVENQAYNFPFLNLVHLCRQLVPRLDDLKWAFEKLFDDYNSDYSTTDLLLRDQGYAKTLIEYSMPFLFPNLAFDDNIDEHNGVLDFVNENNEIYKITYRLNNGFNGRDDKITLENVFFEKLGEFSALKLQKVNKPNPYFFIIKAFEYCIKNTIITP